MTGDGREGTPLFKARNGGGETTGTAGKISALSVRRKVRMYVPSTVLYSQAARGWEMLELYSGCAPASLSKHAPGGAGESWRSQPAGAGFLEAEFPRYKALASV